MGVGGPMYTVCTGVSEKERAQVYLDCKLQYNKLSLVERQNAAHSVVLEPVQYTGIVVYIVHDCSENKEATYTGAGTTI